MDKIQKQEILNNLSKVNTDQPATKINFDCEQIVANKVNRLNEVKQLNEQLDEDQSKIKLNKIQSNQLKQLMDNNYEINKLNKKILFATDNLERKIYWTKSTCSPKHKPNLNVENKYLITKTNFKTAKNIIKISKAKPMKSLINQNSSKNQSKLKTCSSINASSKLKNFPPIRKKNYLNINYNNEICFRSNSQSTTRPTIKQNLITSLRKSIFPYQESTSQSTNKYLIEANNLTLPSKSLSNKMFEMLNKGKNQLAIVRSHSLENNKFVGKKKNQNISKSQSKLMSPTLDPTFDEFKLLPFKWSFSQFYDVNSENMDEHLIYIKFFKFFHCYDLMPNSSKLVVFDTRLIIKRAFSGLVTHGVKAAPVWDSKDLRFVGMLTISYFINILINNYKQNSCQNNNFEEQKLDCWKEYFVCKTSCNDSPFISIHPDESVYNAIKILLKHKIHRLPVLDPKTRNVIYVLTHKRILKFFFIYLSYLPMPKLLYKTLKELELGTYENIETVTPSTCLINALNIFVKRDISSLPILDEKGKLIDAFCKFDLFYLAANKMYSNLSISIEKTLEQRLDASCEPLVTCFKHSTLYQVIELFVSHEAHRLIIVDQLDHVVGIIALSDVLNFLITEHQFKEVLTKTQPKNKHETRQKDKNKNEKSSGHDKDKESSLTDKFRIMKLINEPKKNKKSTIKKAEKLLKETIEELNEDKP